MNELEKIYKSEKFNKLFVVTDMDTGDIVRLKRYMLCYLGFKWNKKDPYDSNIYSKGNFKVYINYPCIPPEGSYIYTLFGDKEISEGVDNILHFMYRYFTEYDYTTIEGEFPDFKLIDHPMNSMDFERDVEEKQKVYFMHRADALQYLLGYCEQYLRSPVTLETNKISVLNDYLGRCHKRAEVEQYRIELVEALSLYRG